MSHLITLKNTGESYNTEPDETLLSGALRTGINFPHGCKAGACGSCKSTLLSGEIHYPDGTPFALLEEDIEAGKCLPCCAVAVGDIEINAEEFGTDFEPWD